MATKRKWWSENWQSTTSMAVMLVFTMGVVYTQLQFKVDRYEVQEIVAKEAKDHSFPLVEGVRLQSEYKHIRKDLDFLKKEMSAIKKTIITIAKNVELSQRSHTMANKELSINLPGMAISPGLVIGIQDKKPIRKLGYYNLE